MTGVGTWLRGRLVQRIYAVGLLQFAIVAVTMAAVVRASRRPATYLTDSVHFLANELSAQSTSRESLDAAVRRVATDLHWGIAIYDRDDKLLAAAGPPIPHPFPATRARAEGDLLPIGRIAIALGDQGWGHLEYAAPGPPLPPVGLTTPALLVLVVVGVSSWLTARSIATPLGRLTATANALGHGDLSARASLTRTDELGDVARAFDQMADRMASAIRAERELLANISHELRTPLHSIRIAIDLAAEGDADTARESLREIAEDLSELERLVGDVLSATRLSLESEGPSSAVPPLRDERVDARGLLDKAAARFRSAHPERRLDASIDADGTISGDAVLLRRVIDNLLENAHKYSDERATPVCLRSQATEAAFVVEVQDQGIGIAREDLPRVFEPFFRADRSRTRAAGGVGLGLALAKRIVDAHDGRLTIESELGRGTTVRVELPRAEPTRDEAHRSG